MSLLEVLVAAAIVGVVAALLAVALARGKQESYGTIALSNLRQAGVALHLYATDHDSQFVRDNLDPLIDGGYVRDSRVMMTPGDPYEDGYGLAFERVWMKSTAVHPTSYNSLFTFLPALQIPKFKSWSRFLDVCPNPGLIVSLVHPSGAKPIYPKGDDRGAGPGTFLGPALRFRLDGSVKRGRFDLVVNSPTLRSIEGAQIFCEDFPSMSTWLAEP
ncbi:MAG: hypothetical protein IT207_05850 [Fimbriimonadaceae bacterium]|nr:hypothetical protein [Fimbriimonadaceae bacterium]